MSAPEPLDRVLDLRLGRLAVRRGLLDEARLRAALEAQADGVRRGRKKPRRLGVILAERGWISDAHLAQILEEQEALVLAAQDRRREEGLLGRGRDGRRTLHRGGGRGGRGAPAPVRADVLLVREGRAMGRGALRQRRVAVKVLRVGAGDASADEIRRFTREAHLAAAIALAALAVTPATGDRAARRGEAVAQAGEYERAIEVFDQALCENPAHAGARARRAESLQRVLGGAAQEVEERGAALDRARQDLDVARPAMQEATLRTEAMLRGRAAEAAKAVESAEAALRQARERLKAPTDSGAR